MAAVVVEGVGIEGIVTVVRVLTYSILCQERQTEQFLHVTLYRLFPFLF